jgi:recombinational DNA repair ATPase RecF
MSEVRKGTSRNTEYENKRCKIFNKVLNMNWDYVRVKKQNKRKIKINKQKGNKQRSLIKENPVQYFSINTISYAVNLINFIIITSIYYITKQRVCETISIIKM